MSLSSVHYISLVEKASLPGPHADNVILSPTKRNRLDAFNISSQSTWFHMRVWPSHCAMASTTQAYDARKTVEYGAYCVCDRTAIRQGILKQIIEQIWDTEALQLPP